MSAPTTERPTETYPSGSPARRRRSLLLAVAALVVVAAAGSSLALANRPALPSAAVAPASQEPVQEPPGVAVEDGDGQAAEQPRPGADGGAVPGPGGAAGQAPVLADGVHHAYITRVDPERDRITVDVVQRFVDDDAVEAAIADGRSRQEARYLHTWLRNENPRLRTLPLAADLRVELWQGCEGGGDDRRAVLDRLADSARRGGHYYTLTVAGGQVQRIQERQIAHAC
jgi:hypothetical protein